MNKFKNSLKDARQFVKKYLNLFKYGRGDLCRCRRPDLAWRIIANALIDGPAESETIPWCPQNRGVSEIQGLVVQNQTCWLSVCLPVRTGRRILIDSLTFGITCPT